MGKFQVRVSQRPTGIYEYRLIPLYVIKYAMVVYRRSIHSAPYLNDEKDQNVQY